MSDMLNFDNTQTAFINKTDNELKKAKFLFGMLGYAQLTRFAKPMLNFAFKYRLPIQTVLKKTIFSQFCGGENLMECKEQIDELYLNGEVMSILDYSVEGFENEPSFDNTLDVLLKICEFSEFQKQIPFLVFKPTGIGRLEVFRKVSENVTLSNSEAEEWDRIKERFETICRTVSETESLKIMVDAEESWSHAAVDKLTEEMMVKYNKRRTVVFTTIQLYLCNKYDYLKKLKDLGEKSQIKIGVKLVRGAYMEKERDRAFTNGYESPVCKDKATTDQNFENGSNYVLENLDVFDFFLGTHNELSCKLLAQKMMDSNIDNNDSRIWFGQLFGMSDNISFNMAQSGYNVVKYVPFGPIKDVMPYLIRRAEENSSVGSQSSREIQLLKKELQRRNKTKKAELV
ncbi:proline dehydrogenase family protein [Allomuricauda sp. F6463D]|uniref:proline dehydrogenase family protein n=1 Tax=Allomuricauda sp. F6463D TaxID=2926409 RepID=UPI001FF0EEFD|nr:proline dehydrogenase family protein [Muricauda sp. F6463D]MCK0159203.1 proline dehydrogenase family protein [Muricauda sp. F6463D]